MTRLIRIASLCTLPLLLAACATVGVFDQATANRLQTVAAESEEFVSALLASPSDISLQSAHRDLPAPLAGFMSAIDPQQASVDCFIDANTSEDNDGDTIPVDAFFTVDCSYEDGNSTVTLVGTMTAQDDDDSDPLSGYDVSVENFEFRIVNNNNGNEFVRAFDFDFDLDRTAAGYDLRQRVDFTRSGPLIGTANLTYDASDSYDPDLPAFPFSAGTFDLDDLLTFVHNGSVYTLTRTSSDLHYTNGCVTDSKFDSGTVDYADSAGNSLQVVYTACGTATGTFTSGPAQAGF
jgi:hypothetical protein